MATTIPSLETIIEDKLRRQREPRSILDDQDYMEQQEAYEILLYNQELNKDLPTPEPTPQPGIFNAIGRAGRRFAEKERAAAIGLGEAGLQAATGSAAFIGGGIASLASYLNRIASESRAATQDITGAQPSLRPTQADLEQFNLITRESTYQPRTPYGQTAGEIMMLPAEAVKFAADWAQEKASTVGAPPEVSALFGSAVEIAALILGDRALRTGYRRGVGMANRLFQNLDAGNIPAATTEARNIVGLIGPSELTQARQRMVEALRQTERYKSAEASWQPLRDMVERVRSETLRPEVELQLLNQINSAIPANVNKIEFLQNIGYSPNEANIINARLSTLQRPGAAETFNLTDAIRRFEDPASSREARINAIEEIRTLTADRSLEDFGIAPAVRNRLRPMLEAPETFEPPMPGVEDITARDVREGVPIYSPEGQFLPQGAPPVAGSVAQQNAARALAEARAIRRGQEPPEPLPATVGEAQRPVAPSEVSATRTAQQIANDALDILLSDESTLTTRGQALIDLKREALKAKPRDLEDGLRLLGVEEEYINTFLPLLRNVSIRQRRVMPTEITEDITPSPAPQPATPSEETTFTTELGSTYVRHSDGTTTRNKAARPEHPGDFGLMPRSETTFFLSPEDAQKLSIMQATNPEKFAVEKLPNGQYAVIVKTGPNAGRPIRGTNVTPINEPTLGMYPIELWQNGEVIHFGNKITSIGGEVVPTEIQVDIPPESSPVKTPTKPAVVITPDDQVVLDEAFQMLSDPAVQGVDRGDFISNVQGLAEKYGVKVTDLPGVTAEKAKLITITRRRRGRQPKEIVVPATPTAPTTQNPLYAEYLQGTTTLKGRPNPSLVMAQALRSRGVELSEPEFVRLGEQLKNVPLNPTALAEFMQSYLQTRNAEVAKTAGKLNDGNIAEPKAVTTEDRAQYVDATQRTNSPYTIEQILENLGEGVDITSELPPKLAKIYAAGLKYHNKKLTQADRRSFQEIAQSIVDIFPDVDPTTLGAFNPGTLGPKQKLALQQLVNDAKREGKNLLDIIRDAVGLNDFEKRLYIEYVRGLDIPSPKPYMELNNMSFDVEASTRGDQVIKRRRGEGDSHHPPVYNSDLNTAMLAKEMTAPQARTWYQRGLRPNWIRTNGIRIFESAGLQEWMYAYRGVEQALQLETSSLMKTLSRLKKNFNPEQRQAIMLYALAQEEGGLQLLRAANRETRRVLTPEELAMYETFRGQFDAFEARANAVRANVGKEPLKHEENYFTFIRSALDLERGGIRQNIAIDEADVIDARFQHSRAVPIPYEKSRTGATYVPELDSFQVFAEYARRMLEYIHITPFKAKILEIIDTPLKDPITGATYNFKSDKPVLHDFLTKWTAYIGREQVPLDRITPTSVKNTIYAMDKNLTGSLIAFNEVTALTQLTALYNTYIETGGINLTAGIIRYAADLVTPGQPLRTARLKNSKLLNVRNLDLAIDEFASGVGEGILRRNRGTRAVVTSAEELQKAGTLGIRIFDGIAAEIGVESGYLMGKRRGLSDVDAWNLGDDVLTRTQGSTLRGDRANIQRSVIGRAVTRFQNYAINNWDQLTHDIFGIDNPNLTTKEKSIRISRWLFGGAVLSAISQYVFGYSPVPDPLGAGYYMLTGEERPKGVVPQALRSVMNYREERKRRIPEDENIINFAERIIGTPTMNEALKVTPIIGGARVSTSTGMGPLADYTMEAVRTATGQTSNTIPELLLRGFVPGGSTLHQMFRPERQNTKSLKTLSKPTKPTK